MKTWFKAAVVAVLAFGIAGGGSAWAASGDKLKTIKSRGEMKCGVAEFLPGFSFADTKGKRQGFDIDFCYAVAAAVGVKVRLVPLTAKARFPALTSGEIDVLIRNTTWTLSRDTKLGVDFTGVNYYDGQGFMVRKSLKVKSARKLDGAAVCVASGTTTEKNLADYFRANRMKYKPVVFEKQVDVIKAYEEGRCDAYTTDASGLAATRTALKKPTAHVLLPEIISKEPLGPVVAHGDNNWGDIVRWTLNALIIAEEAGITKKNVRRTKSRTKDPGIQRLLGKTDSLGENMGLSNDWAVKAILSRGNYGEIFARHLGHKTPLRLKRGLNQLWSKGGILYAPPAR